VPKWRPIHNGTSIRKYRHLSCTKPTDFVHVFSCMYESMPIAFRMQVIIRTPISDEVRSCHAFLLTTAFPFSTRPPRINAKKLRCVMARNSVGLWCRLFKLTQPAVRAHLWTCVRQNRPLASLNLHPPRSMPRRRVVFDSNDIPMCVFIQRFICGRSGKSRRLLLRHKHRQCLPGKNGQGAVG